MFRSIFNNSGGLSIGDAAIIFSVALAMGLLISVTVLLCDKRVTKNFAMTLVFLPVIVAAVILMVNGNNNSLGIGIAVAGAFSLVRFRSIPGTGKDILFVFFAMAVGLCLGVGHVVLAVILCIAICIIAYGISFIPVGRTESSINVLSILVPETLNFDELFKELFKTYLKKCDFVKVKTVNLGTMFEVIYHIEMKDKKQIKEFIDQIRTYNGNLNVSISRITEKIDSL